ncbi:clusterin-like protein 1 [Hippocampus zosterae]|uniref:clusterin-like protein 1 n=1 Tax=Hippocampus zosterae TaxID=109293 RepID=UPI00223E223C|nr:clusterin-like protein 1 [Hippocampus zosterae]
MQVALSLLALASLGPLVSGASEAGNATEVALKELSKAGETVVGEEVKRALYGVGQMREAMWRNQLKHEHLMESLHHSGEKKKGAARLAQDVTEKLREAEERCGASLRSQWDECRPCLEDACKTFFTNTCRRGFATFQTKVENFFRRVSRRFSFSEAAVEADDILANQEPDGPDAEAVRIQDAFARLSRKVGLLVNRSAALASRMGDGLDRAVRVALLSAPSPAPAPDDPARDSGFLRGVGLEEVLDSFFDFGRSVVEEFGAVVTGAFDGLRAAQRGPKDPEKTLPQNGRLCRDLRKQSSECWRLQNRCEACQGPLGTECPGVSELHAELRRVWQLLAVSREQYDEVLSIVRLHADETLGWLSDMAAELGWVARADAQNVFRITRVVPKSQDKNRSEGETQVEGNVLNSPSLVFSVPGELNVHDPAFIRYVAQEALERYKEMIRYQEDE